MTPPLRHSNGLYYYRPYLSINELAKNRSVIVNKLFHFKKDKKTETARYHLY